MRVLYLKQGQIIYYYTSITHKLRFSSSIISMDLELCWFLSLYRLASYDQCITFIACLMSWNLLLVLNCWSPWSQYSSSTFLQLNIKYNLKCSAVLLPFNCKYSHKPWLEVETFKHSISIFNLTPTVWIFQ